MKTMSEGVMYVVLKLTLSVTHYKLKNTEFICALLHIHIFSAISICVIVCVCMCVLVSV